MSFQREYVIARPGAAALALAFLAACTIGGGGASGGSGSGSAMSLAGTTWRLAELRWPDDRIGVVHPDDPAKYDMTLGADGAVAMRLDCNRGVGRWMSSATNQTQGTITFTPLAMTRAACLAGSLDTRIARELGFVRSYMVEGDRLILVMMADGGTQVWMRAQS
jgi:heat shock protein HslJ